jgi:hypothetical protein
MVNCSNSESVGANNIVMSDKPRKEEVCGRYIHRVTGSNPPALFKEPPALFEATCVFAHAKKKGKTSNQEPSIRVASAKRKCVALVRHSFFKQLSSMYFWRGRNAPMRRGVLLV